MPQLDAVDCSLPELIVPVDLDVVSAGARCHELEGDRDVMVAPLRVQARGAEAYVLDSGCNGKLDPRLADLTPHTRGELPIDVEFVWLAFDQEDERGPNEVRKNGHDGARMDAVDINAPLRALHDLISEEAISDSHCGFAGYCSMNVRAREPALRHAQSNRGSKSLPAMHNSCTVRYRTACPRSSGG